VDGIGGGVGEAALGPDGRPAIREALQPAVNAVVNAVEKEQNYNEQRYEQSRCSGEEDC
jgi:hypothetical protein